MKKVEVSIMVKMWVLMKSTPTFIHSSIYKRIYPFIHSSIYKQMNEVLVSGKKIITVSNPYKFFSLF